MTLGPRPVADADIPASVADDRVTVADKGRWRRLRKLTVLVRNRTWLRALRRGVAASVEHRDVPFGSSFATIIDVGAHHGQFALLARERYPIADIVCLEPLPNAVERLGAVHGGDERLVILPYAVANEHGHRAMHVSRKTDSSSLLPILQPYVDAFPGTEEAQTFDVEVRTLDALFASPVSRPALLKIDVQGGELEVLAGAGRVLAEVDVVFVECSFVEFYRGQALADQVVSALLDSGLRLDGVYSVVRDARGRCLQADMLFRRRS